MLKTEDLLLSLVRKGALGEDDTAPLGLSTSERELLFSLASSHDMAHIVGGLLQKTGDLTDDEPSKRFKKAVSASHFRYVQMENALGCIASLLEEAQIPFLPLKGAVIRGFYPDPTMRTSCDIDVLVKPEHLKNAVAVLTEKGGYTAKKQETAHDISLYSVDNIHLELHFDLMERDEKMVGVLSDVWDYAHPAEGKTYQCVLSDEMFMLHHIVHMAKHFVYGGCGIRPLLDLYLIRQKMPYDTTVLESRLAEAGLVTFYENAILLSNVWFGDQPHTELTRQMEAYLLRGGVFGTLENHARNAVAKRGKIKHFLLQLFPPAHYMKKRYPTLAKCPILLPWFYIWRILCFAVKPYAKDKVKINMQVALAGETEEAKQDRAMMQALDLENNQLL